MADDQEDGVSISRRHLAALRAIMVCSNCACISGEVWRLCAAHAHFTEIPHFGEAI